jgi:hypothetical protein
MASNTQFPLTRKYLTEYGQSVIGEMKTRLTNQGKEATGTLHKSLRFRTQEKDNEFIVSFFMAEYGQYVDKGVNGYARRVGSIYSFKPKDGNHKPRRKSKFIESLKKWCKVKGLPEGAAFPIRRNIWKFGIKPTNFFTIPTTRRQKQFEQMVAKNMAKDIDNNIK